jgi:beta-N-acetylhexosaminidase
MEKNMEINNLSLEEKIGQLFIVGRKQENIGGLESLIEKYKIGGIILYKLNYKNYEEMLKLVNKIKTINYLTM